MHISIIILIIIFINYMVRNFNLIVLGCILISSFKIQAQVVSTSIFDSVYCYLTVNIKMEKRRSCSTTELLIYNGSKDTVVFTDFNKCVHHVSNFEHLNNLRGLSTVFYWNFLSISNQEQDGLIILGGTTHLSETTLKEKNFDIIIPPDDMFVSEVKMMPPSYPSYRRGYYYKLCLYYAKTGQCVAEMVVKY